jgi:4-hydroxybenzoate polyprenyltransferase
VAERSPLRPEDEEPLSPVWRSRTVTVMKTSQAVDLDAATMRLVASLPPLLRAMRPLQWTKNLLVFAALIFTRSVFEAEPLLRSIGAFVAFCAVSSGIYLINDVRDVRQDRLHPVKRLRPIAAGEVDPRRALLASTALIGGGWALAFGVRVELLLVLALYVAVMIGYNLGLKQFVLLDVILISLGFVMRAAAGAVAIDVPISPWLYMCTLLLALLVGFGKRRHELLTLEQMAAAHRQNLETYSVGLLDQIIGITAASTIVAYSMYTFESPTLPENHAMMLTIPIVVYAIFRYLYLLYRKRVGGSPELLLIRDRPMLVTVLVWVLASGAVLYWG